MYSLKQTSCFSKSKSNMYLREYQASAKLRFTISNKGVLKDGHGQTPAENV